MSPTQCYDTSRSIQLALAVSSGLYYLLGSLTVINTAARTDRKFTEELTCCASSGSYLRNQPCLKVPHWQHTILKMSRHFPHPGSNSISHFFFAATVHTDHRIWVFEFVTYFQSIFILIRYGLYLLIFYILVCIPHAFCFLCNDSIVSSAPQTNMIANWSVWDGILFEFAWK